MPWAIAAIGGSSALGFLSSQNAASKQADAANNATQVQLGMFNKTQANLAPWMQSGQMSLQQLGQMSGLSPQRVDGPNGYWTRPGGGVPDSWVAYDPANDPTDPSRAGFNPNAKLVKPFGMEDFQQSPAYQFNLEQGTMALDKAAAARHSFYSPATLQQIAKYSQGIASNEFQNAYSNYNTNMGNIWSRLSTLSGSGQNAAANLGTNATQVAGQVGSNIIGAGNAQAAGQIGGANAVAGGVGNAYNAYLMNQILSNNQTGTYSRSPMGDYNSPVYS